MMKPIASALSAAAMLAIGAVAHAQYTDPVPPRPARSLQPQPANGEELFKGRCGGCHLEGGFGTRVLARRTGPDLAQLERRTDLPADYVRTVARHGLGSMPMFRKAELSDPQLDAIATYLAKGAR